MGALSLREIGVDGLPESVSNLSAYVFPRAMEIHCLPTPVNFHIFFNASQLICGLCRHRFAQNTSYLPPPFKYYGRDSINACPCLITSRQKTEIQTSVMRRVCDFKIRFFMPKLSLWIHFQMPKLIGQVSEGGSMNVFKLAEDEAGMMVFFGVVIPSKRGNCPGWMIATTGMMLLHGILDSKSETKSCRLMEKTSSIYPSLKRLNSMSHSNNYLRAIRGRPPPPTEDLPQRVRGQRRPRSPEAPIQPSTPPRSSSPEPTLITKSPHSKRTIKKGKLDGDTRPVPHVTTHNHTSNESPQTYDDPSTEPSTRNSPTTSLPAAPAWGAVQAPLEPQQWSALQPSSILFYELSTK